MRDILHWNCFGGAGCLQFPHETIFRRHWWREMHLLFLSFNVSFDQRSYLSKVKGPSSFLTHRLVIKEFRLMSVTPCNIFWEGYNLNRYVWRWCSGSGHCDPATSALHSPAQPSQPQHTAFHSDCPAQPCSASYTSLRNSKHDETFFNLDRPQLEKVWSHFKLRRKRLSTAVGETWQSFGLQFSIPIDRSWKSSRHILTCVARGCPRLLALTGFASGRFFACCWPITVYMHMP